MQHSAELKDRLTPTMDSSNGSRIVFHAVNQIGLGHLSRLSAIALAIRRMSPETPLLFVVSGASHGVLEAAELPYVTSPYIADAKNWPSFSSDQIARFVYSIADSVVRIFQPSLLVFDSIPDLALITAAVRRGIPFAFCMRKMKRKAQAASFAQFAEVFRRAHLIVVPHEAGEVDIPVEFEAKTYFVGTIVRPLETSSTSTNKTSSSPQIVISGGGGGYPRTVDFYNTALDALTLCRREQPELSGLLVAGPLFEDWRLLKTVEGVEIMPFAAGLPAILQAASVVICQAGYNTVAEITSLGVPAIVVPAPRTFDDQYERAAAVSAMHHQILSCAAPDASSLAPLILELLREPRQAPASMTRPTGADLTAKHLLSALHDYRNVARRDVV